MTYDPSRGSPRQPLPTREQIAAIDDPAFLKSLLDDVSSVAERIEVDLEFGFSEDASWEGRALAALALHRSCFRRLAARVAEVQRDRAAVVSDKQVEKTKRTAMSVLEGVSFGRAFMEAAKAAVDAETYSHIIEGAQRLQDQRLAAGVERIVEAA